MDNIKVSVIIPVYNAERYIGRCLDSVINQTLKDIEIIVVNDGSVDESKKIIEEYQKKDKRIKFINQSNKGAGAARNAGLKEVDGEYISFIDADDYVANTMLEELYELTEKEEIDLVCSNYFRTKNNIDVILNSDEYADIIKKNESEDFLREYTWGRYTRKIEYTCSNSLYKSDIIKKNNIRFEEDKLMIGEDYLFNLDYFKYINSIYCYKKALYYYYLDNDKSVTSCFDSSFIDRIKNSISKVENRIDDKVVVGLFAYRHFQYTLRLISLSDMTFNLKRQEIKRIINDPIFREKIKYEGINKLNFEKKGIYFLYKLRLSTLIILFINFVHIVYRIKEK